MNKVLAEIFIFTLITTFSQETSNKYSILITQRDLTCFDENPVYAFCLKDGFKFDCKDFSADIEYEKIGEGLLKIKKPEGTTTITFKFKDGEKEIEEKIKINYYCFKEIKPKNVDLEIKEEGELLEITAYFKKGEIPLETQKYSASALYGKALTIQNFGDEKILITYQRKFKYPYKDIITLKFEQIISFIYISVPHILEIKSETEPYTKIKASTKFQNISTVSDEQGKFRIKIKIFAEDEFINFELKDRSGNITKEKVKLEFPKISTDLLEVIQTENGLIVFTNTSPPKNLSTHSKHIYTFFPLKPGEYSVKISGRSFKIYKKNFPAILNVEYDKEKKEIYADGTSEISFLIKITDIYQNEVREKINIEHNYEDENIKIDYSDNKITILVKKLEKDKLKISFSYDFLKEDAEFTLLPGPPAKIIAIPERDYVYGDGKDKINIQVFLQDRAGNNINTLKSDIYAKTDYGKIQIEKGEKGIHKFTYTANSMSNIRSSITFEYENLSEKLYISILAKKFFLQLSPNVGIISNLKTLIPTIQIQLSYARLLGGRYIFFDTSNGYFQNRIQEVNFKSIYNIFSISSKIWKELKLGLSATILIYQISFEDISETALLITPGIRISYNFFDKISLNTFLSFPPKQLEKSFIIVDNTFERLIFSIGYTIDL